MIDVADVLGPIIGSLAWLPFGLKCHPASATTPSNSCRHSASPKIVTPQPRRPWGCRRSAGVPSDKSSSMSGAGGSRRGGRALILETDAVRPPKLPRGPKRAG